MVAIKLAHEASELEGILALQRRNLRRCLSDAEAAEQGFLIAEYDLPYLRRLQERHPSVIAVDEGRVVGQGASGPCRPTRPGAGAAKVVSGKSVRRQRDSKYWNRQCNLSRRMFR